MHNVARAQRHAARPARTRCARLYKCAELRAEPQQPGTSCQERRPVRRVGVFPLEAPRALPDDLDDLPDDADDPLLPPLDDEDCDRELVDLEEDDEDLPPRLLPPGDLPRPGDLSLFF